MSPQCRWQKAKTKGRTDISLHFSLCEPFLRTVEHHKQFALLQSKVVRRVDVAMFVGRFVHSLNLLFMFVALCCEGVGAVIAAVGLNDSAVDRPSYGGAAQRACE